MKITTSKPEKVIVSAVKKYKDFIAPTYGPAGKKILIVTNEFVHEAVDDGKRSSQAFEIEDELENAVIQYIKETTQKGKDGTTTAGLIMSEVVLEALKDVDNELASNDFHGHSVSLKKGLTEAVKKIRASSKKIKTKEELEAIAYNSYNNEAMSNLVSEVVHQVGKDGVISIEDSKGTETTSEVVNGLEIPKGYASPYLINVEDKVILEKPVILLVNKKINLFSEIAPIIKKCLESGVRSISIIAEGFGDDVINKCIAHKMMGAFIPLLVETPGYGDKLENLTDIAVITGAKVIDDKVYKLSDANMEYLGSCDIIKSSKDKTTILGGSGDIKEHVKALKNLLETSTNNFEKDKLTKRIAVVSGGVAVIKVGAYTENEQKAVKAKVENAVNSTQIAYRSGVVAGAGKCLATVETSSKLLNHALKAPRVQLERNGAAYLDENTVDPTDIVITALETAVSIASGLITLGGIVVPKREKKEDKLQF